MLREALIMQQHGCFICCCAAPIQNAAAVFKINKIVQPHARA